MKNDAIRWHTFPRDVLPELLLGGCPSPSPNDTYSTPYGLSGTGIAVGRVESRHDAEYNPPALLVLGNESAVETRSWLKVYAPETHPLSQYARVVSSDDWRRFYLEQSSQASRADVWSSIVLGEALAQGEGDIEISALPLSRASACFSMPIARAACMYGTDDATRSCADRLRQVEADRRFVRRAITVDQLLPVWSMARILDGGAVSAEESAHLVFEAALKHLPDVKGASHPHLRDIPGLSSDSIEQRVVTFQELSANLIKNDAGTTRREFAPVLLAAAAFLVGRSTTHQFLLRRIGRQFPSALVWYGLIAAVAGPAAWDVSWSRAVKSIERQVRSRFDWLDSVGFDLCWLEYKWLASAFEGPEIFVSLPKLMPRVLSVEILPGATCQFRLSTGASQETDVRGTSENQREKELQATLAQFVTLANRAQHLLGGAQPPVVQSSLNFGEGDASYLKTPKAKKTRATRNKGST